MKPIRVSLSEKQARIVSAALDAYQSLQRGDMVAVAKYLPMAGAWPSAVMEAAEGLEAALKASGAPQAASDTAPIATDIKKVLDLVLERRTRTFLSDVTWPEGEVVPVSQEPLPVVEESYPEEDYLDLGDTQEGLPVFDVDLDV